MEKNGYAVEKKEEFIHRKRAYHIYLENRKKYPLPYSAYEVHHKDFNKKNNKVENLEILTPTEHDKLHEEQNKKEQKEKEELEERKLNRIENLKTSKKIKDRIRELPEEELECLFEWFNLWNMAPFDHIIEKALDSPDMMKKEILRKKEEMIRKKEIGY